MAGLLAVNDVTSALSTERERLPPPRPKLSEAGTQIPSMRSPLLSLRQ